jgi:hypothetical protein
MSCDYAASLSRPKGQEYRAKSSAKNMANIFSQICQNSHAAGGDADKREILQLKMWQFTPPAVNILPQIKYHGAHGEIGISRKIAMRN